MARSHNLLSIWKSDGWSARTAVFAVALLATLLFWSSIRTLVLLSLNDDRYVQIVAGPLIAVLLIALRRDKIFADAGFAARTGALPFALSVIVALVLAVRRPSGPQIASLVPVTLVLIFVFYTAFLLCYNWRSFRRALYPLACLLLIIPVPAAAVDRLTALYQQGSAQATYFLFSLFGVSVLRNGTNFSIPGLDFNIAPECSGIRSGIAFIIVAVVAGYLFLRSAWGRLILLLATAPIAILKNAIRIVVTTSLGAYVDHSFIDGPFHHRYGGLIFGPVDFLLFVPLLLALQKAEKRSSVKAPVSLAVAHAVAE